MWGEGNTFDIALVISARSEGKRRTEEILCASLLPVGRAFHLSWRGNNKYSESNNNTQVENERVAQSRLIITQ